jgi:hypothetical protein
VLLHACFCPGGPNSSVDRSRQGAPGVNSDDVEHRRLPPSRVAGCRFRAAPRPLHRHGRTGVLGGRDTTDVLRFYRDFVADALTSSGASSGSARSHRCRLSTRISISGRRSPWPPATPDRSKTASVSSVRSASSGPPSWTGGTHPVRRPAKQHRRHRPPRLALLLEGHEPHRLSDEGHPHRRRPRLPRHLPRSYAAMFHMGGAVARAPRDATAYRGREVDHNIIIDAAWLPEQDDTVRASETAWARHSPRPCSPTAPAST